MSVDDVNRPANGEQLANPTSRGGSQGLDIEASEEPGEHGLP